jgi:hypothetical protein
LYVIAGIAGILAAAACSNDVLTVQNQNNPDIGRVLNKPADVESIIGSSFNTAWQASVGGQNDNVNNQMAVMSLENGSSLANFGMGPRIGLPRSPIDNTPNNAVAVGNLYDFNTSAKAGRAASLGLVQLNTAGFTIGSAAQNARARAFAFFVMGFGNANAALVYDSAAPVTETNSTVAFPPLLNHDALMTVALGQLDSAIAEAGLMTAAFPLVSTWIPNNALTGAQFVQLIRSYKARFRAEVARTPAERAAVDWTKVRDDALAGITADFIIALDPSKSWSYVWYVQHFLFDTWTQQSPMFLGMADSSGGYDTYLATGINSRSAFLIRSADQRLPPGDTRGAQQIASGTGVTQTPSRTNLYFRNRVAVDPASLSFVVSQYDWYREQPLYNALRIGPFPMLQKSEMDLLAAEAYFRLGDLANAIIKINNTRVGNGKLPPLPAGMTATDLVPGGGSCVPRVPNPATSFASSKCGTLFEALKWEKRMELAFVQYGAWFFDSRGWGDLAINTPIEWPVPYNEMQTRAEAFYNSKTSALTIGTYGY